MAKIRALMYREWQLVFKNLLIGGFSVISLLLLALLFYLSAQYGNLKEELNNDLDSQRIFATFGYYFVYYMTAYIIIALAVPIQTYKSDITANWCRFELSLPVSPRDHALAHILGKTLRMLGGWVMILAITLILNLVADRSLNLDLITDVGIITVIVLLIDLVTEFCYSSVKDSIGLKKASMKLISILVTCGLVVGLLLSRINMPEMGTEALVTPEEIAESPIIKQIAQFRSAVQPFVLPAIILLLILTYLTVKRGFKQQRLT